MLRSCVSAIYHRDVNEQPEGQVVEMGLYESIFRMMEFLIAEYDQNGKVREKPWTCRSLKPCRHI